MNMKAMTFLSLGEKGPIIWQSRFKVVLLEVAFYVKAGLCRSQPPCRKI